MSTTADAANTSSSPFSPGDGSFHGVCLAAPRSGEGKTTFSIGLMRLLARKGFRVQGFKCGPDYIDPTFHAEATGRPACNLDTWMMGPDGVREAWQASTADADIAICEGVMGLFDGRADGSPAGSTADCARVLGLPVLLVVNVRGMAASLAALVEGFTARAARSGVRIAGIIADNTGSPRHVAMLRAALEKDGLPPLLCALPRRTDWQLPERQLGLVPAGEAVQDTVWMDTLADAVESGLDFTRLMRAAELPRPTACGKGIIWQENFMTSAALPGHEPLSELPRPVARTEAVVPGGGTVPLSLRRMAIARDEAFCFYYEANERALRADGWELAPFSPLRDSNLPDAVEALYLGGGYPEIFARQLAENTAMRGAIRAFAATGKPIYAECGGYMTLAKTLVTTDGQHWPMYGLIDGTARMGERLRSLGYREVELCADTLFAPAGTRLRGHEFHWSDMELHTAYPPLYLLNGEPCGVAAGSIRAGYGHLYWAHRPASAPEPEISSPPGQEPAAPQHQGIPPSPDQPKKYRPASAPEPEISSQSGRPPEPDALSSPGQPQEHRPFALLLNGVSSAGKTTLARRLQQALSAAGVDSLLFSLDALLAATGGKYTSARAAEAAGLPVIKIFHAAIAQAVHSGATVIIDHVVGEDPGWIDDFYSRLGDFPCFCFNVHCELQELEQRELSRKDRRADLIHLHRQRAKIYNTLPQDGVIDTTCRTPEECAQAVLRLLRGTSGGKGLRPASGGKGLRPLTPPGD